MSAEQPDAPGRGLSAQRYTHPVATERMSHGLCPECGMPPKAHQSEIRFWVRAPGCDLLPMGVSERIAQWQIDDQEARHG